MATYQSIVPGINQKVLFEVASQRVRFECHGFPTGTIACAMYDTRYDRGDTAKNPIVSGNASRTFDEVLLTAAAGPALTDPRNIPYGPDVYGEVSVGDPLWIENAYHQRERIIIAKYSTSAIGAADPLVFTYAKDDKLQSTVCLSPEIPTAWVSDEDNLGQEYLAEWTYTVEQTIFKVRTRWDLTREIQDSHVDDSILFERFPDLGRFRFRSSPETFLPLVKAAQRDVDAICWKVGVDPNKLRSNERLKYLVETRAQLLIAENGVKPNGRDVEEYIRRKQSEWDDLTSAITEGYFLLPVDSDNDDIADDTTMQTVTLVR